jgi:predicted phage terminase large subunit-like protein
LKALDYPTKLALAIKLQRQQSRQQQRPRIQNLDNRDGAPSFAEFIRQVAPFYQFSRFHTFLAAKLEAFLLAVEREESPRLALSVPTRYGKSQVASVFLPAYAIGRNPDWPLIHASYTADLSNNFSREVRNLLEEPEYQAIFPGIRAAKDRKSVEEWAIQGRRGKFVSAGIGGGVTGRGAKMLLIDDPVKNSQDADSERFRAVQRDWYASTARTRLEKGAGVLIIATRWHTDDLIGYVTTGAGTDEPPADEWDVVNIPAIAVERNADGKPVVDPLGRAPGEPLWPEKYDLAALAALERQMPPRWWQAIQQGAPVKPTGNFFDMPKIGHAARGAEGLRIYQAWDLAISKEDTADYVVGTTLGIDGDQNAYLLDRVRDRWSFNETLEQMEVQAKVWKPISIAIESNGYQAAAFQEATRRYMLPFVAVKADRDKQVRAQLLADRIACGKFFVNKQAPWWREWEAEATAFPTGSHDDQVDSCVLAIQLTSNVPWGKDPAALAELKARLTR